LIVSRLLRLRKLFAYGIAEPAAFPVASCARRKNADAVRNHPSMMMRPHE
jgi:hypothetical protein